MADDIKARLRDATPPHHGKCLAAADHIETLEARIAELEGENERLRKSTAPQWFYAEGWEERCFHSPDEVIDFLDMESGSHVVEVPTGTPCATIWCAVTITDDDEADERFTFTEHTTEAEARAALNQEAGRDG